jgi:hypothetical protein
VQIEDIPIDLIVAVATVIAVLIAVWELRANAKTSGQTHAREAWMRYLDMGFNNPQFGSTQMAIKHLKIKDITDLWDAGTLDTERYWWFLDIMMEAAESLVNYFPEKSWQDTIKYNISLHEEAVRFLWQAEKGYYSDNLNDLVDEVCFKKMEASPTAKYPRPHPGSHSTLDTRKSLKSKG